MTYSSTYDVVVVGAGVFGACTAWHLAKRGQRVLLVEAYGPGHSRASSGGESRIIRMGYGPDEIYTRWSQHSLEQWKELFAASAQKLFIPTGVLWLASAEDERLNESTEVLQRCGIAFEVLDRADLLKLYPQMNFDGITAGVLEPESGVLLARRAVACVVSEATRLGAQFEIAHITAPATGATLNSIFTSRSDVLRGGQFVFACGPWLGKLFPELLGPRIFPTRQEVFFFGTPAGDPQFASPALPTWFFQDDDVYGMPDIESRGLKMARDLHGELVDPDTQSRLPSKEGADWARKYVARRFPALKNAEITETRVCQYENTSNGDFLIDRHPQWSNVWLAGGGSGHGFKHGPAFGEYLAGQILDGNKPEPRFSLTSKATERQRSVY
jgi:monomeric sarcosine oxidase